MLALSGFYQRSYSIFLEFLCELKKKRMVFGQTSAKKLKDKQTDATATEQQLKKKITVYN